MAIARGRPRRWRQCWRGSGARRGALSGSILWVAGRSMNRWRGRCRRRVLTWMRICLPRALRRLLHLKRNLHEFEERPMAGFDIFEEIETLRRAGAPFCVATVIRTADATWAKAVVTGAGEIIGHLGGACVQRAVCAASTEALSAGAPRLISVRPSETVVTLEREAEMQLFKSGCPSGGTVDLLIEPWRAAPCLMIHGATPIARALAEHAALMGFRVIMEEGAEAGQAEVAWLVEGQMPALEPRDFVVVASQGRGDIAALQAALATQAGRVSMVASRRKAEVLREKLAAQGVDAARLAVLKSPAGLNIGAVDPHEIALSILAEIVAWTSAHAAHPAGRKSG